MKSLIVVFLSTLMWATVYHVPQVRWIGWNLYQSKSGLIIRTFACSHTATGDAFIDTRTGRIRWTNGDRPCRVDEWYW